MWRNAALWAFLAGLAFALAGFICTYLFLKDALGDWRVMFYAAPLAAFLCGVIGWGMLVVRSRSVRRRRGLWVGALVGLVSHPLAWYGSILYFYLAGEPGVLNPLEGVWASLVYTLLSLVFVGWLTVPVGAITGGLLAYAQAKAGRERPPLTVDSSGPTPGG